MENRQALTPRQREIFDHLRARQGRGEPPPGLDELCTELGLSSRGSLHKQVQALIEAGLVEPPEGKRRGLRVVPEAMEEEGRLPLLGRIAAGRPIEAVANPETIEVPASLRTARPCYVLGVRGDSMIEDGILDGDLVIIEQRDTAKNGEVVVALIDGEEATLKRIEQKPGEVVLHPANGSMPPMHYAPEQVRIQGVLVGQMRRY